MALVNCKECKKEVSNSAKTCPHCGVKDPAVGAKQKFIGFLVLVAIVFGISQCTSDDDSSANAQPKISDEECMKDLKCWGDQHSISAAVYCAPFIEKLAKNSHEWTDGMLEPKFSHFRWKDQSQGYVTFIGDKIQYQNGFGAWINHVYECDFDPRTDSVLDVRASAGKI